MPNNDNNVISFSRAKRKMTFAKKFSLIKSMGSGEKLPTAVLCIVAAIGYSFSLKLLIAFALIFTISFAALFAKGMSMKNIVYYSFVLCAAFGFCSALMFSGAIQTGSMVVPNSLFGDYAIVASYIALIGIGFIVISEIIKKRNESSLQGTQ
jgi:hypothetical protein